MNIHNYRESPPASVPDSNASTRRLTSSCFASYPATNATHDGVPSPSPSPAFSSSRCLRTADSFSDAILSKGIV